MKFSLKSKIVKMEGVGALEQRYAVEKATRLANKYAVVDYDIQSGYWKGLVFSKNGDFVADFATVSFSSIREIAREIYEPQINQDGRVFFQVGDKNKPYFINGRDAFVCPFCGKILEKRDKFHRCRVKNICSKCGCQIDKKLIEKHGSRGICPACYAKDISVFSSYSTKPTINFLKHSPSLQDFGIELEVDDPRGRSDVREVISKAGEVLNSIEAYNKTFAFCSDGSLYHGFEIKTSPRPLKWYSDNKKAFEDAFAIISEAGFKAHDTNTAGLHISLNLANRSEVYALKMAYFWNKNIKFFDVLARRTAERSGTCYFQPKALGGRPLLDELASKSHRDVINLEHLSINRLEVRHFRSTLKFDTLLATLDLMQAVDKFLQSKTTEQILKGKYNLQEVIDKLTTDEGKAYVNSKKQALSEAGFAVEV